MNTKLMLLPVGLCACLLHGHAQFVLFDNLDRTSYNYYIAASWDGSFNAQMFTTDADNYGLSSVTLRLRTDLNPLPQVAVPVVQLVANGSGDVPSGTVLATLSNPGSIASGAKVDATFTLSSPYSLAPNSKYWITMFSSSDQVGQWWSLDSTGSGIGFSPRAYVYELILPRGMVGVARDTRPFQMSVTVVPEPCAWVLAAGLGLLGFATCRRLGRRAAP
jgi:hypothetical protein